MASREAAPSVRAERRPGDCRVTLAFPCEHPFATASLCELDPSPAGGDNQRGAPNVHLPSRSPFDTDQGALT
jgi:hypothetical protein